MFNRGHRSRDALIMEGFIGNYDRMVLQWSLDIVYTSFLSICCSDSSGSIDATAQQVDLKIIASLKLVF